MRLGWACHRPLHRSQARGNTDATHQRCKCKKQKPACPSLFCCTISRSIFFALDCANGATYREIFPARYGVQTIADTKTRADVRAEYAEARRNGDLPADAWINVALGGVAGSTLRDVFPGRYPVRTNAVAGQQVLASK